MIIFGGKTASGFLNDVWVLSKVAGETGTPVWTELAPTGVPPVARDRHLAFYDATNNRMIVFGGTDSNNKIIMDLWTLTNANGLAGPPTWSQLSPGGGPAPRVGATGVHDVTNNRLIIFGGLVCQASTTTCDLFNEVWVLSNANGLGATPTETPTWSQLTITGNVPSPRQGHTAVYDAASNKMIIQGGNTATSKTFDPTGRVNDAWVLSNANGLGGTPSWSLLSTSGSPPALSDHTALYDAASNHLITFGGGDQNKIARQDVWILINANGSGGKPAWAKYATGGSPLPRSRGSHAAIHSPTQNRVVIFGGVVGDSLFNDAWALRSANGVPKTPVSTITISAASTKICPDNVMRLAAVAKDAAGNDIEGVLFIWALSDETIAEFTDEQHDPNRYWLKGTKPGTVTITACSGGVCSEPFKVTITPKTKPPPVGDGGGGGGGPKLSIPSGQSAEGCLDIYDASSVVTAVTLVAWGGAPLSGYTWTLSNLSTFPAGTTVDPLTGILHASGGKLVPGTHSFNMTVSDGSTTASGTFAFTVETASSDPSVIPPGFCSAGVFEQSSLPTIDLPDAKAGAGYGAGLFVSIGGGSQTGTLPLTWSLAPGESLPSGLVIDASRGVVRGTPFSNTAGQTFSFKISVKDNTGKTASCSLAECPTYKIKVF